MGRKRTAHKDLPPRLYLRRDGYYYRDYNGKEARVAKVGEKALALIEWAKREGAKLSSDAVTFRAVAEKWREAYIPTKAEKTQKEYGRQLNNLVAVFGESAFDSITPNDVDTYRCARSAKVQANRELAVLSILWNWARAKGYTGLSNPVSGIKRNKETGRSIYMADSVFKAIYLAGDQSVKDTMRLGLYTSMDVSVLLRAKRTDVSDNVLHLRRSKTDVPVRYRLTDKDGKRNHLGDLVDEMLNRKRCATGPYLIQDDNGQRIPYYTFADRFERARAAAGYQPHEVQFRDIRPKVASDQDDPRKAQALLGHKHLSTTERHYIRIGKLVDPAK